MPQNWLPWIKKQKKASFIFMHLQLIWLILSQKQEEMHIGMGDISFGIVKIGWYPSLNLWIKGVDKKKIILLSIISMKWSQNKSL